MKKLRKFMALVMALSMLLALSMTAFAAEHSLTISGTKENHTYEVYQIFTGDLAEVEGKKTLSNIKWGTGVAGIVDDNLTVGEKAYTATEFAEMLAAANEADVKAALQNLGLETVFREVASSDSRTVISELPDGYYLVKDKDKTVAETDAYTEIIVQVVGDTVVQVKSDVPTVEKKIKDINDTTGEESGWQDSADYDIGDLVPFQLTATLPENYEAYEHYFLSFEDTLSDGLSFQNNAKIYAVDGSDRRNITGLFTVDENKISFTATDLRTDVDIKNSTKIVVEYTAKLNENAVLGSAGNPNEVELVFSNNPNAGGEGERGKTPKDKVVAFTYKTVVNKINKDKQPLSGAEFTLSKLLKDGSKKEIAVVKNEDGTSFAFNGLDDGDYILTETKTPAGFNTIAPITFTITATHDEEADEPKLTDLNGEAASGEITFTKSVEDGSLTADVVNVQGVVLPSTGGMGTTLLYGLGALLVMAAGTVLVVKRRREAE